MTPTPVPGDRPTDSRTTASAALVEGQPPRRTFLYRFVTGALGAIVALFPFAAGLGALFDPLRRRGSAGEAVRVARLDQLPTDGTPRRFPVIAERRDGWTNYGQQPVGAVYLRRTADGNVEAWNVTCPHLGCSVTYQPAGRVFYCPCHNSSFDADGRVLGESPSPRDLDTLTCTIQGDGAQKEVWVEFQNFFIGIEAKRAKT